MKKQYIKPPFLTTSFSESGKGAKRRFANILTTKRRKAGAVLIAATLTGVLCFGALVACEKKQNETLGSLNDGGIQLNESGLYKSIDDAVHAALLEERDSYAETEFFAEGHIMLGVKTISDGSGGPEAGAEAYAITSVGGYSFMNDMFIKDAGSGAIPAVIVLKTEDGGETYAPEEIRWPMDGSYYEESIKEMFPEEYHDKVLSAQDYYSELIEQEHEQAREYLKVIGREAEIGDYIDLNAVLPDMNTEASNYLLSIKSGKDLKVGLPEDMYGFPLWKFPMYQGTHEYIQDGKRYIYETNWEGDKSGGAMHYTVYNEDGDIVVAYNFMVDGEKVLLSTTQRQTDGDESVITNYCY